MKLIFCFTSLAALAFANSPSSSKFTTSVKATTTVNQKPSTWATPTPTQTSNKYVYFPVNYNYDTVGNGATTPVAAEQIAEYDLLYHNLTLVSTAGQGTVVSGLRFSTFPNAAGIGAVTQIFNTAEGAGTGGGAPSNPIGPGVITGQYLESNISYFWPVSFFYGCVVASLESVEGVPASCNITVDGFNRGGQRVANQVFQFIANGSLLQNMNYGIFNSQFQPSNQIYSLNLQVSNNLTTGALFDNLDAVLFEPPLAPFYPNPYLYESG